MGHSFHLGCRLNDPTEYRLLHHTLVQNKGHQRQQLICQLKCVVSCITDNLFSQHILCFRSEKVIRTFGWSNHKKYDN